MVVIFSGCSNLLFLTELIFQFLLSWLLLLLVSHFLCLDLLRTIDSSKRFSRSVFSLSSIAWNRNFFLFF
ncbi:hypothetical protein GLYMA_03G161700v4 [Glycine max]|uniref:Uncharacterized protein n=1 Tax=Glycine max TaxID=3847 RepID=A0A0R0KK39_SOYBN|nr:hypothetical protein JHK86_007647 [Glycine max]KAH1070272.1 hypothetical protein GYH30_007403 [Glycine max]KRH67351.1 hypothetical protein GLYMA_03G161700v4 [Glycine max]